MMPDGVEQARWMEINSAESCLEQHILLAQRVIELEEQEIKRLEEELGFARDRHDRIINTQLSLKNALEKIKS